MKLRTIVCLLLITATISCKTNNGSSGKLTYIFNSYKKIGTKEYLDVRVFGSQQNGNLLILVEDWHKLEEIRRTKGMGYRGSELNGLEVKLVSDPIAKYSYKNLKSIID